MFSACVFYFLKDDITDALTVTYCSDIFLDIFKSKKFITADLYAKYRRSADMRNVGSATAARCVRKRQSLTLTKISWTGVCTLHYFQFSQTPLFSKRFFQDNIYAVLFYDKNGHFLIIAWFFSKIYNKIYNLKTKKN